MASEKTQIIESIFTKLWDPAAGRLTREIVTFDDLIEAIREYNRATGSHVSAGNPANFYKDLTRSIARGNDWWPRSVFDRGYTCWQLTGKRRAFEFIPVPNGQTQPFVAAVGPPAADAPRHPLSTVAMPLAVRALARSDEPSLLQLSVRFRLVETHMSLFSSKCESIRQIEHLQNSVKLRRSEIDAIFLATEEPRPSVFRQFLITCEAKGLGEDVTMEQIVRQPLALLATMPTHESVVPIVIRALGRSELQVAEFEEVHRDSAAKIRSLALRSEAVYQLRPPVPGFWGATRRSTKKRGA